MQHRFLFASLLATSVLGACIGRDDTDATLAEESIDSALTGQSEAAVVSSIAVGASGATPAQAAASLATQANFSPAGCASVSTTGATTTIALDHCTGTRGLVEMTGTITVQVTAVTPTSVTFTASGANLEVNDASLDLAVTATYRSANGSTSIDVSSTSSGVGPRGHAVAHTGDYVATWDDQCASVDGSWSTTGDAGRRALDVSVTRCRAACPTGSVTRERVDGSTLTIDFDGTATASYESSRRGTGTISLPCTP